MLNSKMKPMKKVAVKEVKKHEKAMHGKKAVPSFIERMKAKAKK